MNRAKTKKRLLTLSMAAAMLPSTQLFAAGTDQFLEEVIVTSRKQVENLQDTPIAISAHTGEALNYRGASNVSDVAAFTPNLTFQNNPSFGGAGNAAAVYIRGIGQKEFLPTTEPGVGIYVDGIYIARSVGAILDLVEVERLEVLRGPQGTLFGRNSIGGAMSLTTKKPTEKFGGNVEVKLGTDNRQDIKGKVNIPISETLLSSFSIASLQQDGYVEREDGIDLGDDNTLIARGAITWKPTDDVTVDFSADMSRDRENGPALTLIGINPGVLASAAPAPPFATIYNASVTFDQIGVAAPCAVGGATTPGLPPIANCFDNTYVQGKDYNAGTARAFSDSDLEAASLNVEWIINDNLEFRSITGVRSLESEFSRDGDHSPFAIQEYYDDLTQDQFSQEFQLLGTALDEKITWILGAYYFEEDGTSQNELNFVVARFRSGGDYDNEAKALFGQATWDIDDQWSLTLGLRYTEEDKSFFPDQIIHENYLAGTPFLTALTGPVPDAAVFNAPFMQAGERILPFLEKDLSIEETTPMANLSYQATDALMVYASYSEGFKSGGFTQRVFPPIVAGATAPAGTADIDLIPTFEPEFVEVIELGFKYRTLDNRFRINGALFETDYTDMQIQVFDSVAPVTKNAGSATLSGVELEAQAVLADSWLIDWSLAYLDGSYDKIDEAQTLVNKGNTLERISDWTSSLAISKEFELDSIGTLIPRIDVSYQSKMYHDTLNTAQITQGDYSVINTNVTWLGNGNGLKATLGIKNLTDEEYLISGIAGDAFQTYEGLFDRGREWYLSVGYEF